MHAQAGSAALARSENLRSGRLPALAESQVMPAEPARPPSPSGDDEFDQVPAAVVCARCGAADCFGCDPDEERSGFLTIVPWERRGSSLGRLWMTARLATDKPESFFEALPDGSVVQALRFAIAAELAAAAALFAIGAGVLALALPALASHVLATKDSLAFVLRATVAGLPIVAAVLVGAHVVHALSIDRAARKAGARGQRTRALRFGLYAAGWDVVLGPIGLVMLAIEGGPRLIGAVLRGGGGAVPGRATRAFLRGAYGISGEPAKTAMRGTFAGAVVATILAALVLLALAIAFIVGLHARL